MMNKFPFLVLLLVFVSFCTLSYGEPIVPNTFSPGDILSASKMNSNFSALENKLSALENKLNNTDIKATRQKGMLEGARIVSCENTEFCSCEDTEVISSVLWVECDAVDGIPYGAINESGLASINGNIWQAVCSSIEIYPYAYERVPGKLSTHHTFNTDHYKPSSIGLACVERDPSIEFVIVEESESEELPPCPEVISPDEWLCYRDVVVDGYNQNITEIWVNGCASIRGGSGAPSCGVEFVVPNTWNPNLLNRKQVVCDNNIISPAIIPGVNCRQN